MPKTHPMFKTISLLSQKGGVGKSTLTMMLLNALYHHYGYQVLLIDADFPQNSIYKKRQREIKLIHQDKRLKSLYEKIYQGKEPYPILKSNLRDCPTLIEENKQAYKFIFVDITGTVNQEGIAEFFQAINYFFIPIFQDDLSLISSMELYSILHNNVQPISPAYQSCKIIFNKVPAKNQVQKIKTQLDGKVDFLAQTVSAYTAYERAYRSTVFPMPRGKKESNKFFQFVDCFIKAVGEQQALSAA